MTDLDTFRGDTRAWLEANCPAEMRTPMRPSKSLSVGQSDMIAVSGVALAKGLSG